MDKIKFGTDGWRGIIARDFTLANVAKFAYGLSRWLTSKFQEPSAVIGYDCRFGGEMFMEAVAKILASKNIRVYMSEGFVSTPMVSLAVVKLKANCGVVITASHNAAEYNGIKLKGSHGGPMFVKDTRDIENLISSDYEFDLEMLNWNYLLEQGLIQYINIESIYLKNLIEQRDFPKLNESGLQFAFDAMYGSAQRIFTKIMPQVKQFHCEVNPSFMGITPEPLPKNLHELEEYIYRHKNINSAMAVDGDGDRVVLYDEQGNFLDSHQVLLLLIHYLAAYKNKTGKVAVGISTTGKVEKLCNHYKLEVIRTPIGFKEISELMLHENILVGGEESGGMSTGDYIPERDGVWVGLILWEWMAESGKKLSELMEEVYSITGRFAYERLDLELNKNLRNKLLDKCSSNSFSGFGEFEIQSVEDLDGYKYFFDDNKWVMIRASGTEPVIRIYAEAENQEQVSSIINATINTINSF